MMLKPHSHPYQQQQ
jgi:aurora kinase, other